jgi:hypothetical protein
VGTATPSGTFDEMVNLLDHLLDLGVTALELMPVAQFPGLGTGATTGCSRTRCSTPTAVPTG